MHVGIIASLLVACVVHQVTSQVEPIAKNMAPHDVHVVFQDQACMHELSQDAFTANISWQSPRISHPIHKYVIHVSTPGAYDTKTRVDGSVTRQELHLECNSAYVLRVEALYESGESAFSDSLFFVTEDPNSKVLPQALSAVDVGKKCKSDSKDYDTTSIRLSWKPAQTGPFNLTGYTVTVTHEKRFRRVFHLSKYDNSFVYDAASCEGPTFFSVNARALASFPLLDETVAEISLPAAFAVFSDKNKAYIVPAPQTTTRATTVTEGYTTASQSVSSSTTKQDSTTLLPHESTTHFHDVEPAASGLSTSSILCIVLIPLAVILLAVLLFFGYKKYKQGGEGLLSTSGSP
uniref:Putative secreted mucin n=1 Tax=Amblyomma triste TaxID=251400 RepID=A0A023G4D8_AMBTT